MKITTNPDQRGQFTAPLYTTQTKL